MADETPARVAAPGRGRRPSIAALDALVAPSIHLRLLGSFGLTDGHRGVDATLPPRAQALIAYIVLHRDVPQPRGQLSFLLWPDSSEAQARNSLRQLIHQLRRSWPDGDRFLSIGPGALSLRSEARLRVDVDEFERAVTIAFAADQRSDPAWERAALELAAGLYQGELLPGSYDDWIVPERERLASLHERLLDRLIGRLEQMGDYRAAIEYGQQRLRLDALDERVARWLMRLYALNQDRAGALRVYHTCALTLERELGVEPDAATRQAYEQILAQDVGAEGVSVLAEIGTSGAPIDASVQVAPLVGRAREWDETLQVWRRMSAGESHLLLVAGEAGIGKSRLAEELSRWASHQGVESARTRAYAAEGRLAYAPVADWLRSPPLARVLPRLDAGTLSEVSRLLPELLARRPDVPRPSARIEDWQRQAFFQALATAFLAAAPPLHLVLDDLQWCDADTLEWIHFLLRSDRHARILVTATLRPDEIDAGHPAAGLIAELRDAGQMTEIALGPLDPLGSSELAAEVAEHPLSPEQGRLIHLETEGNPLFVVEMVRAGLIASGRERSATAAEPRDLPPKMRSVIAGRLAQLSGETRELAALAGTIGRAFTLEVVREASALDENVLIRGLDELLRRQIVREHGNGAYDFAHDKIREVAYAEQTEAHRRWLHRRVAEGLERVHAAALDGVAAQIAAHYATATLADRAVVFYQRAAGVAQRIGANQEAIGLLHRGLAQLESLPLSAERDARELGLQTALGVSLVATVGYGGDEVLLVHARSRELCEILGQPLSPPLLRALALVALAQARIEECHAIGDQLLSLAEREDDPVLRVEAHFVIAAALLLNGPVAPARAELEASLSHYDRARSATHIALYSQDPAVVCLIRLSLLLWIQGDPEGSARRRAECLSLAGELGHAFSLAYALTWDAIIQSHHGDPERARSRAEAAMALGRNHRMPFWLSIATVIHGWAVAELSDVQAGIDEMSNGMADFTATGSRFMRPFQLGLLAEQYGRLGEVDRGLSLIEEGLALVEATDERWCEPELHRRKGDLLVASLAPGGAEIAYRRAMGIAHDQGAGALELRSAARLGDLRLRQERPPIDLTLR